MVIQGAWVTAAVVAAQEALGTLGGRAGRVLGVVAATALALLPVAGLTWLLIASEDQLVTGADPDVPAYMVQSAALGPAHGILILEGTHRRTG